MNADRPSRSPRAYNNAFREEQAKQTRERILETCVELMRAGTDGLSVPRISERSGISAATIYRHFPDRDALFDGVDAYMGGKLGRPPLPETLDELIEGAPALFRYYDAAKDLMRVIRDTPVLREQHAARRKGRDRNVANVVAEVTEGLEPRRATAIGALLRSLYGFDAYDAMHARFGLGPEEASEVVSWAVRTLVRELEKERGAGSTKRGSSGSGGKRRERR